MGTEQPERSQRSSDTDTAPAADAAETNEPPTDALLRAALAAMVDNLAAFGNELSNATQLFHDLQARDGGRIGCMMALKAVIDFCDNAGVGQESRRPLLQLYVALASAENGATDPILRVVSRANAPPLTDAETRQRGCLAGAMEALMRGGSRPDDAARWVANKSRKMTAAGRVKTDLWKAVKKWRVAAMGGNKAQDWDAIAYFTACKMLDQGIATGQQGAEKLLKMAAAEGTIQETPELS